GPRTLITVTTPTHNVTHVRVVRVLRQAEPELRPPQQRGRTTRAQIPVTTSGHRMPRMRLYHERNVTPPKLVQGVDDGGRIIIGRDRPRGEHVQRPDREHVGLVLVDQAVYRPEVLLPGDVQAGHTGDLEGARVGDTPGVCSRHDAARLTTPLPLRVLRIHHNNLEGFDLLERGRVNARRGEDRELPHERRLTAALTACDDDPVLPFEQVWDQPVVVVGALQDLPERLRLQLGC